MSNNQTHPVIPVQGGRVECGLFGVSDDFIDHYQSLDKKLIKNKASTFFFRASSDSMAPLILEKDILVVDRSLEPHAGQVIVVAGDGHLLCKRLIYQKGRMLLRSENPAYKDIEASSDGGGFSVWGVVTALIRENL